VLIIGLLREEDWVDRNHLITELRRITGMYFDYHPEATEERRLEALKRWEMWWTGVKLRYGDRKPEKIDWLLDALADESYQWRHVIVPEIAKSKDPRAVEPLIKALATQGENASRLRMEAAAALGQFENAAAAEALLACAVSDDEKAGLAAAMSLAAVKPKDFVGRIVQASMENRIGMRRRFELAIAAFQIDNTSASEPALIAFCRDAASDEHALSDLAQAVPALATCGTSACLEVLDSLAAHNDPAVRERARRVREKVKAKIGEAPR